MTKAALESASRKSSVADYHQPTRGERMHAAKPRVILSTCGLGIIVRLTFGLASHHHELTGRIEA
jgi:hypothetical protein